MKRKKLRITEQDYLKANRKASRQEEIESHGHPVQGRAMIHKSKKVYDRNRMKRAAIKSDDSSLFFSIAFAKFVGVSPEMFPAMVEQTFLHSLLPINTR